MNYQQFDAVDLAADQFFIQWVLKPTNKHKKFWEEWKALHPEKLEVIKKARELVLQLAQDDDEILDWELDALWQNIQETKGKDQERSGKVIPLKEKRPKWYMQTAAVFLLFLLSGLLWYSLNDQATIEYATNYGEKRTVQLPDNSIVILNANSKITIPSNWSFDKPRTVRLEGEAYFSVTHKKNNQKFIVETQDGVKVEVLGTEFNVSDRGPKNQIVLSSGKIRLHITTAATDQQFDMKPGEMVEIAEISGEVVKKKVRTALYTSWKDNKFIADNASLADIALLLEQNYGYKVVYRNPSLADLRVTAALEAVTLDNLLVTLSETLNIEMTKENNKIIISNKEQK